MLELLASIVSYTSIAKGQQAMMCEQTNIMGLLLRSKKSE